MKAQVQVVDEADGAIGRILPAAGPLVVVAATGTGGDIFPFITLSQGLLGRGHRVLMLVPGFHEALVKAAGVPCQGFGTPQEFQAALSNPDLWDERKGWGVVWNALVPHLDVVRELVRRLAPEEPCVVLSHPMLIPSAALARADRPDLRIVAAYLAPSNLCSSHDLLCAGSLRVPSWVPLGWRQALWRVIHKLWIDPATLPTLNAARERSRLPAVPHFFEHMLAAPSASLGLFPSWYASSQPDWPASLSTCAFVPPAGQGSGALPPELERFLADGAPPIVFTPGTGHQHAADYFSIALKALQGLGRRGVFVTPHAAQVLSPLPASVIWQAFVPFDALLPRVAAVVHHGGIGTLAEALRNGKPQLIVPFAYDQFDNALRLQRLGVAEVLLSKRLSVRRMRRQLGHLLASPEVNRACSAAALRMKQEPSLPQWLDAVEAVLLGPNPIAPSGSA